MNDESLPIEEPSVPENEATLPAETEAAEAADGALTSGTIYEDLSGSNIEETVAGTVISLEDLERVGSDVVHADLFGSFLVCGTLIGLALLRNIHGT